MLERAVDKGGPKIFIDIGNDFVAMKAGDNVLVTVSRTAVSHAMVPALTR